LQNPQKLLLKLYEVKYKIVAEYGYDVVAVAVAVVVVVHSCYCF
jgi:hypothetical protein